MKPIFITGTGTGIGKTLIAAIIAEALEADYWKPVQAGFDKGTDSLWVEQMISNKKTVIHAEVYKFKLAASPHIAAMAEQKKIVLKEIINHLPKTQKQLIIEGAGGLMVPLNKNKFVIHLIKKLKARVIIVSKNELGSINHSLLTAAVLEKEKMEVAGWIFTEEYLDYDDEIVGWSGYPAIAFVKHLGEISKESIKAEAEKMKPRLEKFL